MRNCLPSRDVYHRWANRLQPSAYNSSRSVSFDSYSAYSYAAVIARWVENKAGERAFLITPRRWSVTTGKHQMWLRNAIPHGETVFHVPSMGEASYIAPDHTENLNYYKAEAVRLSLKIKRARQHKDYHQSSLLQLQKEAVTYCRFFKLRKLPFSTQDIAKLAVEYQETAARQAEENKRRTEEKDRKTREYYAPKVALWLAGESVELYAYPDVLLRLRHSEVVGEEADQIETSKGAFVPLSHGERAYKRLHADTLRLGDSIGGYTLRVRCQNAVQIGCHFILLEEVERFAKLVGWTASAPQEIATA
jgi:hypothetical protein